MFTYPLNIKTVSVHQELEFSWLKIITSGATNYGPETRETRHSLFG